MSIILDALRRGRGRQTPVPNPNAAQTDAVLQTLGYGKFNPATPFNRIKRLLVYLALGIVFAIALWAVVIWITEVSLSPASGTDSASAPQTAPAAAPASAPDGAMAGKPNAPIAPPVTNAVPVVPAAPGGVAPTSAGTASAGKPVAPNAPVAPSAPLAPNGPVAPASDRVVVENSPRVRVPDSAPTAPTGAPSRTLST